MQRHGRRQKKKRKEERKLKVEWAAAKRHQTPRSGPRPLTRFEIESRVFELLFRGGGSIRRASAKLNELIERTDKRIKRAEADVSTAVLVEKDKVLLGNLKREKTFLRDLVSQFKRDKGTLRRFLVKHIRPTAKYLVRQKGPEDPRVIAGERIIAARFESSPTPVAESIEMLEGEIKKIALLLALAKRNGVALPERDVNTLQSMRQKTRQAINILRRYPQIPEEEAQRYINLAEKAF